jgi:diacylglycerol O-acyltransferase / wax synthase
VRMMGLGPVFDGMGLINTIYSYGPEIAISFTSDRAIMPDPSAYAAALQNSFEALRDADFSEAKVEKAAKPAKKAKAKAK